MAKSVFKYLKASLFDSTLAFFSCFLSSDIFCAAKEKFQEFVTYSGVFIHRESIAAVLNSTLEVKYFLNSVFAERGVVKVTSFVGVASLLLLINM